MSNHSPYYNRYILIGIAFTTAITFSLYTINMVVFLESTIIGIGLIMPFLAGTSSGYFFGYLYNQRKLKQLALHQAIEQQQILNKILLLSNQGHALHEILDQAIELIINASFAKLQSKGGVFLTSKKETLTLKSHKNLGDFILNNCGLRGVKFGECLCGLAAITKETVYKKCLDHQHSTQFDEMPDHGHYNVPILFNEETLGVIVVYLEVNHRHNKAEVDFLEAVANVLAIIINRTNVDKKALDSESTLKEIQHFAEIGTWTLNIKTGDIIASDEVYTIMGYRAQQFSYSEEMFLNVTHPGDLGKMKKALVAAKNGTPFELESRHFKKDNSIAHIINKCNPIMLENGSIGELKGTIIDVTKLRDNEAELNAKQDLVNGILRATPDMLYLIDLATNELVYCNAVMEKVLEEDPNFLNRFKEIGVKIFIEFAHPDDRHLFDEMDEKLRSGSDFFSFSFRTRAIGKTYRWLEQRILVYSRDKNGFIKQVLVISKDIDEQVQAEENVRNLNEKLLSQFDDIKKVNAELDQFVYSVSHDLRAPLSSILGLVNLSKNEHDETLLQECMTRVGISIQKLDGFIKDILDYSRNSRTEITTDNFSIEQLVNELIDNIRILRNPEIKLEIIADEKTTYVGDRRRISIILNNIISNACKYADPAKQNGFVKITITSSPKGCGLVIKDNGIGINSASLDKVFTMFYRGTEVSEGSGLGLYIVSETVSKLGGTITIDSEEGIGTTISIQIPHSKK